MDFEYVIKITDKSVSNKQRLLKREGMCGSNFCTEDENASD